MSEEALNRFDQVVDVPPHRSLGTFGILIQNRRDNVAVLVRKCVLFADIDSDDIQYLQERIVDWFDQELDDRMHRGAVSSLGNRQMEMQGIGEPLLARRDVIDVLMRKRLDMGALLIGCAHCSQTGSLAFDRLSKIENIDHLVDIAGTHSPDQLRTVNVEPFDQKQMLETLPSTLGNASPLSPNARCETTFVHLPEISPRSCFSYINAFISKGIHQTGRSNWLRASLEQRQSYAFHCSQALTVLHSTHPSSNQYPFSRPDMTHERTMKRM